MLSTSPTRFRSGTQSYELRHGWVTRHTLPWDTLVDALTPGSQILPFTLLASSESLGPRIAEHITNRVVGCGLPVAVCNVPWGVSVELVREALLVYCVTFPVPEASAVFVVICTGPPQLVLRQSPSSNRDSFIIISPTPPTRMPSIVYCVQRPKTTSSPRLTPRVSPNPAPLVPRDSVERIVSRTLSECHMRAGELATQLVPVTPCCTELTIDSEDVRGAVFHYAVEGAFCDARGAIFPDGTSLQWSVNETFDTWIPVAAPVVGAGYISRLWHMTTSNPHSSKGAVQCCSYYNNTRAVGYSSGAVDIISNDEIVFQIQAESRNCAVRGISHSNSFLITSYGDSLVTVVTLETNAEEIVQVDDVDTAVLIVDKSNLFAIGCEDGSVSFYAHGGDGSPMEVMNAHEGASVLALSQTCRWVLSLGTDGIVCVLSWPNFSLVQSIAMQACSVSGSATVPACVAVQHSGELTFFNGPVPFQAHTTVRFDRTARCAYLCPDAQELCVLSTTNEVLQTTIVRAMNCSRVGHVGTVTAVAAGSYPYAYSGGDDGFILLWNLSTVAVRHRLDLSQGHVTFLVHSPVSERLVVCYSHGVVILLNTAITADEKSRVVRTLGRTWSDIVCVSLSSDGSRCLVAHRSGLRTFDTTQGVQLSVIKDLDFSPKSACVCGKSVLAVVSGSSTIQVRQMDTLDVVTLVIPLRHECHAVAFSEHNSTTQYLYASGQDILTVLVKDFDATEYTEFSTVRLRGSPQFISPSPREQDLILLGLEDGTLLRVWADDRVDEVKHVKNCKAVSWGADGGYCVAAHKDGEIVVLSRCAGSLDSLMRRQACDTLQLYVSRHMR